MRKFLLMLAASAALQGCASTGANSARLASLQLFDANSKPHFVLYFACSGKTPESTLQCETVRHAFYGWSADRHLALHQVGMDDGIFQSGHPDMAIGAAGEAYVLAIRFEPIVTPGFETWSGTAGTMTSGFVPGRVGYNTTIFVSSANTGALIQKLSLHNQQQMPNHANVTPGIKAAVYSVIARIDPAYSHP